MKLQRVYGVSLLWVVPILACFLCFSAQTLVFAAEEFDEKTAGEKVRKEKVTEELPPGETEVESPWLFIVDFTAFLNSTHVNDDGENSQSGQSADLLFSPVYQFNDQTFFILMYDGQYRRRTEFYSDGIGGRQREEFQSHTVQPMARFDFGERNEYSLTPSVFATWTYNRDIDTDGWDDGLYNYRDYGGGLDFDWRGLGGDPGTGTLVGQYYQREYPNYASLLSLTGLDTSSGLKTERNEKDYTGVLGKAGYTWIQPYGFNFDGSYSLLFKMLDDKKIVQFDGTLSGDEPDEYLHTVDLDFWYMLDIAGGLKLGLDLRGSINDSDQNYYDGLETASLADDVFIDSYYDYFLYRLRPNISYTAATFPLTSTIYYSYQQLEYDERNAKEAGGTAYKTSRQHEDQKEFGAELRYELTENWAAIGRFQTVTQRSNNDDERTYRYNYTVNYYSIGVAYRY
jgi:hypothetical protein